MTEKETTTLLDDLENLENDIVTLEIDLQTVGLKQLSKDVKRFHGEFIKVIRNVENKI